MYRYRIADTRDDAALRKLLAETPMPGSITVAFTHEPDHFRALLPTGLSCQTLIASADDGSIAGMMCRSIGRYYLNGHAETLGYLGQLRVRAEARSGTMLARGMQFVKTVERIDGCSSYFAVIADGNNSALRTFTDRRHRNIPQFSRVCGVQTFGIMIRGRRHRLSSDIRSGTNIPIEDIIRFLNTEGARRQFFPVYTKTHFSAYQECGLRPEDIFVSLRNGAIAGVTAYWDITSVRQTIVRAYAPLLRTVRPLYNAYLRLSGYRTLPSVGGTIDAAYAAFTCIADDSITVYRELLAAAVARAGACGKSYLMAGFTEHDPLAEAASEYRHILYHSSLFTAVDSHRDGRLPYIEIASL